MVNFFFTKKLMTFQGKEDLYMVGLSRKILAPLGFIEAEAKAFEAGITFAKEVGIREFFLKGASSTIQDQLNYKCN